MKEHEFTNPLMLERYYLVLKGVLEESLKNIENSANLSFNRIDFYTFLGELAFNELIKIEKEILDKAKSKIQTNNIDDLKELDLEQMKAILTPWGLTHKKQTGEFPTLEYIQEIVEEAYSNLFINPETKN